MKTPRKPSPARSQGPVRTPIRHKRRPLIVGSAGSSAPGIISALTQRNRNNASIVVSPLGIRKSILSDDTEIEEPRRKSWWKTLGEHSTTSKEIVELLEENENVEPYNIIEELDMEFLSQENKKNYNMELPESSDSESINSIVITQRKLFPQNVNQKQKHIAQIVGPRESIAKQHEISVDKILVTNKKNYNLELPESSDSESINSIVITQRKLFPHKVNQKQKHVAEIVGPRESFEKQHETNVDKTLVTGTRELFQNKQRSRLIFPAALLNVSLNETVADKTKEFTTTEPKAQVRNIFGRRNRKRKNIFNNFNNFIDTESEDEISDIQPKVFGFQKTTEASRRSSLRGIREPSLTSSITTDMEVDGWKMLPSSTMVEKQLEVLMTSQTPKRAMLSNITEMESEAGSKHSNKSYSSKEDKSRKSKTFTKEKAIEYIQEENNYEELNFSLHYDDEEVIPETQNKSMTSKSMNQKEVISADSSNRDKTIPNKVIEESTNELNESEVAPDEVDNGSDSEEENGKQNESQTADEIFNEDEQEKNEADNASYNEEHDLSLEQNQSEPENEIQEVEDDNEENQNETHADSDTEQNESQVQNESDAEQNDSQVLKESNIQEEDCEVEHNKSNEVEEEEGEQDSEAEQNESYVLDEEQNESEHENQQDSEAIIESSNENEDKSDNSQDKGVDSENEDASADNEIMETPNVSHDTTGRNRKKNKSPEAVLCDSRNLNDSYYTVKGDKTVRKSEMLKSTHRDLVSARESAGFSDGSTSSAQGSGWDSHRTTRKTLRQTYGRDFTPRKSLRALVMEKSAKRQTQHNEMASVTASMFPQANSTEMPLTRFNEDENTNRSPNDISLRTRQTTIEKYLNGAAKINAERTRRIEEELRKTLNEPPPLFKMPAMPLFARNVAPKPKQRNSAMRAAKVTKMFGELPQEVLEDLMYKPPKRFQPRDAPWITKHLYKFLEPKLEPKYNYKSRVRAEKLVEHIYNFTKDLRRLKVASSDAVEVLKREMARLGIVKTHHEFYEFFRQFMPREVRLKVIPNIINNIDLPRQGVFTDIL